MLCIIILKTLLTLWFYPVKNAVHTKWSCPGGGIGTRLSLIANSFSLSSISDNRHELSWNRRLTKMSTKNYEKQDKEETIGCYQKCKVLPLKNVLINCIVRQKII